jgi:hypothetical protein
VLDSNAEHDSQKERIRVKTQHIEQDSKPGLGQSEPRRLEGPKESTIPEDTEDEEPDIKQACDEPPKQKQVKKQQPDSGFRSDVIEVCDNPYKFAVYVRTLRFHSQPLT